MLNKSIILLLLSMRLVVKDVIIYFLSEDSVLLTTVHGISQFVVFVYNKVFQSSPTRICTEFPANYYHQQYIQASWAFFNLRCSILLNRSIISIHLTIWVSNTNNFKAIIFVLLNLFSVSHVDYLTIAKVFTFSVAFLVNYISTNICFYCIRCPVLRICRFLKILFYLLR